MLLIASSLAWVLVPTASAYGTCVLDGNPGNPGGGTACVRTFDSECWAYYAVWEASDGSGYTGVGCNNQLPNYVK